MTEDAKSYRHWRTLAPVIAWCMLIFALSSVGGSRYPQLSWEYADKAVHFSLYLVLGFLAGKHFVSRWPGMYGAAVAATFGMIYGATDEIHQLWVPNRSCSFADWISDAVGTIAGVAAILLIMRIVSSRNVNADLSTNPESMEMS